MMLVEASPLLVGPLSPIPLEPALTACFMAFGEEDTVAPSVPVSLILEDFLGAAASWPIRPTDYDLAQEMAEEAFASETRSRINNVVHK